MSMTVSLSHFARVQYTMGYLEIKLGSLRYISHFTNIAKLPSNTINVLSHQKKYVTTSFPFPKQSIKLFDLWQSGKWKMVLHCSANLQFTKHKWRWHLFICLSTNVICISFSMNYHSYTLSIFFWAYWPFT